MASYIPAVNLGIQDKKGSIAVGKDADFTLIDENTPMDTYKKIIQKSKKATGNRIGKGTLKLV